jgi:hypothetical protein
MPIIREYSPRAYRIAALCAVMPITLLAQAPVDSLNTKPDPLLGVPLGGSRSAVSAYLESRGWKRTVDSVQNAVGKPALFNGTVDGRPAELVAMFSETRDRMLNLVVNVPVSSETDLRSTYAWAYRRMETLRCRATLPPDYRAQLDSVLAGKPVNLPDRAHVSVRPPLADGHTTVDPGNIDWPTPTWLAQNGDLGMRLSASMLAAESHWPYEITLWTSVALAIADNATICPDTRAAAKQQSARVIRPAAPNESIVLDTLTIVAGQGVRGHVGTQAIHTRDVGEDDMRTFTIVAQRRKKLDYSVAADSGFDHLIIGLDDDSIAAKGTILLEGNRTLLMGAERQVVIGKANKKLYDLLRTQLTARDALWAAVDIECEIERLMKAEPDSAQRLIEDAQHLAVDPARDGKALRRVDNALGGHMFEGCTADRATYQKKPQ